MLKKYSCFSEAIAYYQKLGYIYSQNLTIIEKEMLGSKYKAEVYMNPKVQPDDNNCGNIGVILRQRIRANSFIVWGEEI